MLPYHGIYVYMSKYGLYDHVLVCAGAGLLTEYLAPETFAKAMASARRRLQLSKASVASMSNFSTVAELPSRLTILPVATNTFSPPSCTEAEP